MTKNYMIAKFTISPNLTCLLFKSFVKIVKIVQVSNMVEAGDNQGDHVTVATKDELLK